MKTVLVSAASNLIGYGVLNSLSHKKDIKLIGTTIYSHSVAPAFCNELEILPSTLEPDYLPALKSIIKKHNVDMIIPCIEEDMILWNNHKKELIESGVFPLLNNSDLIELCINKWKFYEKLIKTEGNTYAIPTFISNDYNTLPTPFLLKPIRGYGSKGVLNINDNNLFNEYKNEIGTNYIMQPIVGNDDEEYSVSAFFDKNSELLDYLTLKRKLSIEGFTKEAETIFNKEFEKAITVLAAIFKPIGPTNFQFRLTEHGLKLLEINPRISSATSIRVAFGYNESELSVDYFLNHAPLSFSEKKKGYAVRYITEMVFYDRDNI